LSTSPVSLAEIAELRAAFKERPPGAVDNTLQTLAEHIGYFIHGMRQLGADQTELAHDIELLLRASNTDRESIREARDLLAQLGYPREITSMMTRVARKAKPAPPTFAQRMRLQAARPHHRIA
jgi:hypothetical protein